MPDYGQWRLQPQSSSSMLQYPWRSYLWSMSCWIPGKGVSDLWSVDYFEFEFLFSRPNSSAIRTDKSGYFSNSLIFLGGCLIFDQQHVISGAPLAFKTWWRHQYVANGHNLSPLVEIGLTDLPKIWVCLGTPGTPRDDRPEL